MTCDVIWVGLRSFAPEKDVSLSSSSAVWNALGNSISNDQNYISDHISLRKRQCFWGIKEDLSLSSLPPLSLRKSALRHSVLREKTIVNTKCKSFSNTSINRSLPPFDHSPKIVNVVVVDVMSMSVWNQMTILHHISGYTGLDQNNENIDDWLLFVNEIHLRELSDIKLPLNFQRFGV
jgi:hypothetical protein